MTHGGTTDENKGYDAEQLKHREKQGDGLVWEVVRSGVGDNTIELRKRDGWMARLFGSLSPTQQDAMVAIEVAFRSITAGLGMKTFNPMRQGGKAVSHETERQAALMMDYFTWGEEVQRRKLSHAMTVAVIADGLTCAQVDSVYRQRKGTARNNLVACLNVYCLQHGWPYPHDGL